MGLWGLFSFFKIISSMQPLGSWSGVLGMATDAHFKDDRVCHSDSAKADVFRPSLGCPILLFRYLPPFYFSRSSSQAGLESFATRDRGEAGLLLRLNESGKPEKL
ncbi:hypothetical protein NW763_007133 [Fusarium oxysporum]|nr:hypothetical protein NW763_007133 [Fusarium oxysporum]